MVVALDGEISSVTLLGREEKENIGAKAGTAYVRLYWAATEFEDELVPSEYLLHPLNVPWHGSALLTERTAMEKIGFMAVLL